MRITKLSAIFPFGFGVIFAICQPNPAYSQSLKELCKLDPSLPQCKTKKPPTSPPIPIPKKTAEQVAWEAANTCSELKAFLIKFPRSVYKKAANNKIRNPYVCSPPPPPPSPPPPPPPPKETEVQKLDRECKDNVNIYSCLVLGNKYYGGDGVTKSNLTAKGYYEKACPIGGTTYPEACNALGVFYYGGLGLSQSHKSANQYFELGCAKDAKNHWYSACSTLGYAYEHGLGVTKDMVKAKDLYQYACENNDSFGCVQMGVLHQYNLISGSSTSLAIQFYEKTLILSPNNIGAKLRMDWLKNPPAQESDLMKSMRQCLQNKDSWHCGSVGWIFYQGTNTEKNYAFALSYFIRSCDLGSLNSCTQAGYQMSEGLGTTQDKEVGNSYYWRGCNDGNTGGVAVACNNLGVNLDHNFLDSNGITNATYYYRKALVLDPNYQTAKDNLKILGVTQ